MKKKLRIGLIILAVILIIGQLTVIKYTNLSWSESAGSYLSILSMILLVVGMILSNRSNKTSD